MDITIGLAQTVVSNGNIEKNTYHHLEMIKLASKQGADIVVFPELSLTGYELELARELAIPDEAEHFSALSQAAVNHNVVVIAGCPLKLKQLTKPTIGAVICFPNGKVNFYSKQYLHTGEEEYCATGLSDYVFNVKGHQIGLAVCADFTEPLHSEKAKILEAEIYLVSALITDKGFEVDAKILSDIATKHKFPVLLANHISETGGWQGCGNNSIWNAKGELAHSSDSSKSSLTLCTLKGCHVKVCKTIYSEQEVTV